MPARSLCLLVLLLAPQLAAGAREASLAPGLPPGPDGGRRGNRVCRARAGPRPLVCTSATTPTTPTYPQRLGFKMEDGVYWGYGEGGRLCRLNLRTGKLTRAARRSQGRRPRSAAPLRRQENPLRLPQGRRASVPSLRDQHRRQRPAPTHRRPRRRHRADLLPRRQHRLLLVALPAVCELLVHARGHALPLRRRRPQHPHALHQQRPRQHALGAARRPRALHALGIRRPQPGALPSPLDDESRRHRPDGLLRQHVPAASPCSTPSRSPAPARSWPRSRPATAGRSTSGRVTIVDPELRARRSARRRAKISKTRRLEATRRRSPRIASSSASRAGHLRDGRPGQRRS